MSTPAFTVIDNHSVIVDLLRGGPILDAGARGFVFAKWFADRGHEVYALDPSPDIDYKTIPNGVKFIGKALVGNAYPEAMSLEMGPDPNGWFMKCDGSFDSVPVKTIKMKDLPVKEWDLIKLNIEGSEYDILDELEGPIAHQIVFSFHEHTQRARGQTECDRIISKLSKWYDVHNQVWEKRYGCSNPNYWDCVLVEKGLLHA